MSGLKTGFTKVLESDVRHSSVYGDIFNECGRNVQAASAKDISRFVEDIKEFEADRQFGVLAGLYLSAAINLCTDPKIELDVRQLPALEQLCFYLHTNTVEVTGDVGQGFAQDARSGVAHLKGNARCLLACSLRGAEVIVDGDAGALLGEGMRDGIIRLNGTFTSLGKYRIGGKIYRNGNLIRNY